MRYFLLISKGLGRNKKRTLLTALAITVALFLFSTLITVLTAFDRSVEVLGESRLVTRHAVSLVFPLPLSYAERIARVDGVAGVSYGNWFGAVLEDRPQDFFSQFAVESETYLRAYPEVTIPPDEWKAFMEERTACLMGETLLRDFGWKIGDNVTLLGTIYPGDWTFTIRGTYTAARGFDKRSMLFHWKYFDEGVLPHQKGRPGFYIVTLSDPNDAARVAASIDALFENSSARTRTETEQAFQQGFIGMMGNVKALILVVGFAVVIAMILVAANTMIMAGRERTREIAVLKALGFDDGLCQRLLLAESAGVAVVGGLLGTVVAKVVYQATGFTMWGWFPDFTVEWSTVGLGLAVALFIGLVAGFVPARRAQRLRIVDALRNVG
jgi:putative ABC transport system permease protein